VNKDLQRVGLTWEEVEPSVQDRQTWRQRVALCIGDAGWIKSSHHVIAGSLLNTVVWRPMI